MLKEINIELKGVEDQKYRKIMDLLKSKKHNSFHERAILLPSSKTNSDTRIIDSESVKLGRDVEPVRPAIDVYHNIFIRVSESQFNSLEWWKAYQEIVNKIYKILSEL